MSFYLQWKYPNTSRKLTKFVVVCLMIYLPIYFFILAPHKEIVDVNKLKSVTGSISQLVITESLKERYATIMLKEYPEKQFFFDKASKTSFNLSSIQKGDRVIILALVPATANNQNSFSSFELIKQDIAFFSLEEYNSGISKGNTLATIFLVVAIIFLLIYFLIEKTGLLKWINIQLSSGDKAFQPEKPNFNEFLDR